MGDMGLMRATDSRSVFVRWAARLLVIIATWIMIGAAAYYLFVRFGNG
jgi:hypothetical protein